MLLRRCRAPCRARAVRCCNHCCQLCADGVVLRGLASIHHEAPVGVSALDVACGCCRRACLVCSVRHGGVIDFHPLLRESNHSTTTACKCWTGIANAVLVGVLHCVLPPSSLNQSLLKGGRRKRSNGCRDYEQSSGNNVAMYCGIRDRRRAWL